MHYRNIILIGFMGCGKTATAKHLASLTGFKWIDTDTMITRSSGKSIEELFAISESYFRSWERDVCKSIKNKHSHIISTGGGIILDKDTCKLLKQYGHIIYLKASSNTLYERTKNHTHRPLLNTPDKIQTIITLLTKRDPLYTATADYILNVDTLSVSDISDTLISRYDSPKITS